ncbi:MAG: hypothetical protein QOD12_892 [Verrucomicrobiota bacterium]|jgi:hypothetical protein
MKIRIHPLIVFLAVASAVSANPSGRTTTAPPGTRDEIEKSFHVRPGGVLKFDADLGNAEIITEESDTVRIEFIREFKVSTSQEANDLRQNLMVEMGQTDLTTMNTDANTVKVTVRFADDRKGTNREKVRLDFRITMPRKFNLDLRTVGSAKVGDLEGSAKASTRGGSLKLGNISGPVTAKSEGGSVTIGNVSANVEARSYGGSTSIGRVNGRVTATAEGGSVSIEEATDSIEARAAGGSIKAWISKQPRVDSKITAEAGNIDLRLNASLAVNVDAACTAGRLSSDFSLNGHQVDDPGRLKGVINGGGPVLMLRASAGNINLRK